MDTHQSSPSQENLKDTKLKDAGEGSMLWDEYKYRHDLIWRHLIRSTLALVVLVTVRYSTAFKLTVWLGTFAWVVALGYWLVTLLAVEPELRLYLQIKNLHRARQTHYFGLRFGPHKKATKWGKVFLIDPFSRRVGIYLLLLLIAILLVGSSSQ